VRIATQHETLAVVGPFIALPACALAGALIGSAVGRRRLATPAVLMVSSALILTLLGPEWLESEFRASHDIGAAVRHSIPLLATVGLDPMRRSTRRVDCRCCWPDAPRGGLSGRRVAPADPR
jgi:hypothetical protein